MNYTGKVKNPNLFGIKLNRKSVVRWKIYLDRARMYMGYINFVMIAFVFLNSFQNQEIRSVLDENKLLVYPLIMVLFIVVSLILGRLDTKLGMRKEEMRNQATENPVTMDMVNSLNEIKEMQQKLLVAKRS